MSQRRGRTYFTFISNIEAFRIPFACAALVYISNVSRKAWPISLLRLAKWQICSMDNIQLSSLLSFSFFQLENKLAKCISMAWCQNRAGHLHELLGCLCLRRSYSFDSKSSAAFFRRRVGIFSEEWITSFF